MVVKSHESGSYIFPDEQICVLLGGMVESKQHFAKRRVPVPHAKFQAGDILGFDAGDRGQTSSSNTWSQCMSEVEAIWMDKDIFCQLWKLQNKSPQKILCHELSQRACFATCTDVSLHLLAFELLQVRTYSSGEVILRQNKRSVTLDAGTASNDKVLELKL